MSVNRRTYLGLLGGALATLGGCTHRDTNARGSTVRSTTEGRSRTTDTSTDRTETPGGDPDPDPPALSFDERVNVVEAFDCDPTGERACDEQLHEATAEGRLLVFPEGRYRLEEPLTITGYDRVGLKGVGDARLVPPSGYNGVIVDVDVAEFLLQNVDIDIRASNTSAGIQALTDTILHVESVEYRGRGLHTGSAGVHGLVPVVRDPGGVATIKEYVAERGAAWGHYGWGNGRAGVYIGQLNRGTVRIVDAHLEEFGGSGIYATSTPGDVHVHGGTFRNNNVASIRIGGAGSFVEGATVEASLSAYDGPRTQEDGAFRLRGVVINQKSAYVDKPPGARVADCNISIGADVPSPGPGITIQGPAKTATVRDTAIRVDADDTPAVSRVGQTAFGNHPPSSGPRWVELDGVRITGSGSDAAAVVIEDAPGSTLRDATVRLTGRRRDGVRLVRSPDATFDGGSVVSKGYPLVIDASVPGDAGDVLVTVGDRPILRRVPCGLEAELREGTSDGTIQSSFRPSGGVDGDAAIVLPESDEDLRILVSDMTADRLTGRIVREGTDR